MKRTLLILVLCWAGGGIACAQSFHWVAQNEVSVICTSSTLVYGKDGCLLNAGFFQGTMDLDPGPGTDIHTSQGGTTDVFVQKLDSNGNYLWGRSWQGTQGEDLQGAVLDDSGNVYLTGTYQAGWDADPGTAVFNLLGRNFETYVVKLDLNGNFLWAVSTENVSFSGETRPNDLKLDKAGNLLVPGFFRYTVDFEPGTGVDSLQNTTISGNNPIGSYPNCFLWRLDPNGNHLGVLHTVAGASSALFGLEVDVQGNILMTGSFASTADFDPSSGVSTLTATPTFDYYIQKLDSGGNLLWVKAIEAYISSIDTDLSGDVYLGGDFANTIDFDPGPGVENMTSTGFDGFLVKWDASGNFDWKKQIQGGTFERVVEVEVAPNGSIFILGGFRDTIDLDPGPGVVLASGPLNEKTYLINLDGTGNYNWGWALDPGNTQPVRPQSIGIDTDGDFAIAGDFAGSIDFDPGPGTAVLNSPGALDGFVAQWSDTSTVVGISPSLQQTVVSIFPNPNEGTFKLRASRTLNDCRITIVDLQGHLLYETHFDQMDAAALDLGLAAGLYLIRVESRELNRFIRMFVH